MLWIPEGFILDDAGNMLTTSYMDLRDKDERTPVRSLVKACKREHALEDGETVLISKPARFREYGVELIRDEQEGFPRRELVTPGVETPEEAAKRRAVSDLNDAIQLTESGIQVKHRAKYSRKRTRSSRARARSRTAIASADSGTRWGVPAFGRSPGMRHSRASVSISLHRAPRASLDRAAARIRNRRQSLAALVAFDPSTVSSAAVTSWYGSARKCALTAGMAGSAPSIPPPATFCST